MGSTPQQPKPTLQDTIIEMKMASKRMTRDSGKSMKESQQYMKKAKEALKKNNEEGAKLYLQSAASKRAESMNVQRMALKMQFIGANMKNMKNNETIMNSFQSMATAVGYLNNPNFSQIAGNMTQFESTMDEMLINGKMMQELMSQNNQTDSTADSMLDTLKGQLVMETANQVNQAAMIQHKEMEFQDNFKKL